MWLIDCPFALCWIWTTPTFFQGIFLWTWWCLSVLPVNASNWLDWKNHDNRPFYTVLNHSLNFSRLLCSLKLLASGEGGWNPGYGQERENWKHSWHIERILSRVFISGKITIETALTSLTLARWLFHTMQWSLKTSWKWFLILDGVLVPKRRTLKKNKTIKEGIKQERTKKTTLQNAFDSKSFPDAVALVSSTHATNGSITSLLKRFQDCS